MPPLRGWFGRFSGHLFHRKILFSVATQSLQASVKALFLKEPTL
ncbi:MAG: hypothetical protein ABSD98_08440 [Candidatus Korobacteraceae bacterium]|jgi:hypothetical protein